MGGNGQSARQKSPKPSKFVFVYRKTVILILTIKSLRPLSIEN
jgi:hypothetical protein